MMPTILRAAIFVLCLLFSAGCCKGKSARPGPEPLAADNPPEKLAKELARPAGTEPKEGIAIALLVDASGSMDDRVMDTDGAERPKADIAKRTAKKIFEQVKKFADGNRDKTLEVGVYAFNDEEARTVVAMGEPDPEAAGPLINSLETNGKTPIGMAMMLAKKQI
ncbi:MAG: vWA domain-containing protein, partial [Pseudomonadota bacterium]